MFHNYVTDDHDFYFTRTISLLLVLSPVLLVTHSDEESCHVVSCLHGEKLGEAYLEGTEGSNHQETEALCPIAHEKQIFSITI